MNKEYEYISITRATELFPGAIPATQKPKKQKQKAINFLQDAGFEMINGNNSDWTYNGLRICINPDQKITLQEFVDRVAHQAAFRTRQQIKQKLNEIDFGVRGYVGTK